ncbi:MAG: ABC transporter permease subunit [Myxococcota bacterium]
MRRLSRDQIYVIASVGGLCAVGAVFGWLVIRAVLDVGAADLGGVLAPLSVDPVGLSRALLASAAVVSLGAMIAVPIGIAAALFTEVYRLPRLLVGAINMHSAVLASVPPVLWGLLVVAVWQGASLSVVRGGLVLALVMIPIVIASTREALIAVPLGIQEAALALGTTRPRALTKAVLPSAASGIATGVLLAVARAAGEAAPLLVVGTCAKQISEGAGLEFACSPLPVYIYSLTNTGAGSHRQPGAAILLLLLVVLSVSASAALWKDRLRRSRLRQ